MDVGARDAVMAAAAAAAAAGLESVEADHRALAAFLQVNAGDIAGGFAHAEAILDIGARLGSRALLAKGFLAVSYTHLDVYKRQAFEMLSAAEGEVPAAALCRACCRGPGMEAALQVLADRGLVHEELRPQGHVVRATVPLLVRLVAQALGPHRLQELRAALTHESGHDTDTSGAPSSGTLCQGWPVADHTAFEVLRRGVDEALAAGSWREAVTLAEASIRRAAALSAYEELAGLHEARARGLAAGGHRTDAVAAWRASVSATPSLSLIHIYLDRPWQPPRPAG